MKASGTSDDTILTWIGSLTARHLAVYEVQAGSTPVRSASLWRKALAMCIAKGTNGDVGPVLLSYLVCSVALPIQLGIS